MKNVFGLVIILLVTAGFTQAQEKKGPQHIKIVIADNDGKKVVIDTTFNNVAMIDSIKLKDGQVVYIGKGDDLITAHVSTGEPGKVVIINGEAIHSAGEHSEVTYNVEVNTDDSGNKIEKTNYVLAKDGIVVTIEGGDEAKVREIAAAIESKLGIDKEGKAGNQEVKEETKKTVKK